MAAALGTPFLPWQRYVADVTGERLPGGRRRYTTVVTTVMRQAGKTVLGRVVQVDRAATRPAAGVWYTAQTGLVARRRWLDTVQAVEASPLGEFVQVARGAGNSSITFPNRSTIAPFAPTKTSLHSETPTLVMVDEPWSLDAESGDDLLAGIKPAQITIPDRQLWLYSTAGTDESEFLWSWVLVGRAAVNDPASRIAYFEWSWPDDADRYDPAVWEAHHPGVGFLIGLEDIAEAIPTFKNVLEFDRAYGNRWAPRTGTGPISPKVWERRRDPRLTERLAELLPEPGELAFGYDVDPDATEGAIAAAWRDQHGRPIVCLIEHGYGSRWLVDSIAELAERHRPKAYGADDHGAARGVTDELRRDARIVELSRGLAGPVALPTRDYTTACGSFLAAVVETGLSHNGADDASDPLSKAIEGATTRNIGESWVWDARGSAVPITCLKAATVALWLYDHPPEQPRPPRKPRIITPSHVSGA